MKYVIVIPDGAADEPLDVFEGQTPLEAAAIPAMDEVVASGVLGRANHVPAHLPPGSDVANMSLFGYDPEVHFTGRAPIEAVAQGIELSPDDWAVRCNLVTIDGQTMIDFTAGHITTEEATQLLESAQNELVAPGWEFVAGVSYRNLLIFRGGEGRACPFSHVTRTTPPHDLTDKLIVDDYPRGPGSDLLNDLMTRSVALFSNHPVNIFRRAAGTIAATNVWLWGIGQAPVLPSFQDTHGLAGCMITAVDLLRGLARLIGWPCVEVPGATGYTDTDYAAKGRSAIAALEHSDIVCVHIEAPDEASHEGDAAAKVKALEQIDQLIVRPLLESLRQRDEYRILVTPDHPTPISTKTHSHGFVPFAVSGTGITPDASTRYDESSAADSTLAFPAGWRLMRYFLGQSDSHP